MVSELVALLTNPGAFFEGRAAEPSLRGPAIMVVVISIVQTASALWTPGRSGSGLADAPGGVVGFPILGVVVLAISGLFLWVLLAVAFHLVSYFFGAGGSLGDLFALVGWGFAPQVLGALVSLVLTVVGVEASIPVDVPFFLWSAYIWTFAVERARAVTVRQAATVVAVPVAAALIVVASPIASPGLDV